MFLRDRVRLVSAVRRWLLRHEMLVRYGAPDILGADLAERWGSSVVQETEVLLARFRDLCRARGTRLVVLLIPLKEQVYEDAWQQALVYNGEELPADQVDRDAPERIVRKAAATAGIELVGVLAQLRSYRQDETLYFAVDPHLTAAGHRVVAQALYEHLSSP